MQCELLGRKVWPPTPTISCDNSLASVGIYSFMILLIYWLVGTWGCYDGCVFIGSGLLFSILLLRGIMDIAYCMMMTLISSNVYLMLSLGILDVVSIPFIEGVRVAALALTVITIRGSIFHHLMILLSISDLYFFYFSYYSFVWYSIITICEMGANPTLNGLYC